MCINYIKLYISWKENGSKNVTVSTENNVSGRKQFI